MARKVKEVFDYSILNAKKFVIVDIETTGLSPDKGGRIIEIGAWKIANGIIVEKFHEYINPGQKIYAKTTELTGITNEMVAGKPSYGVVLPKFYEFIKDSIIVAHNAKFDWDRFLLYFLKKVGLNPVNIVIDTMKISKDMYPEEKKHNLDVLCERLGIEVIVEERHSAIDDAKYTAKCLFEIMKLKGVIIESLKDNYKENDKVEIKADESRIKIRKVKYWEKPVAKNKLYQRLYINLNDGESYGSVYFNINDKAWYVQSFPVSLNFNIVQEKVLEFLSLNSIESLCAFRN